MRIYVASSWRNEHQQNVVEGLRAASHEVYDFRHPEPGNTGFAWSEIDPKWQEWTTKRFISALDDQTAELGFSLDMQALMFCNACILVLPCGRSAHLEFGYAVGAGKETILYVPPGVQMEPELMYKMCHLITDDFQVVVEHLEGHQRVLNKGFYRA